jgi:uracil-DNA glycosylase
VKTLQVDGLHPEWATALAPASAALTALDVFLTKESNAGRDFLPRADQIFRALSKPLSQTKVLIIGQDPYPTPGHAMGLAFAVESGVRPLPRSLANLYRELADDLGIAPAVHGDLSGWSDQGVLLLNRVLSVEPGMAGSHRGRGWEAVTDTVISALVASGAPLVAILWGKDAQRLQPLLGETPIIASAHPSPLSAARGFWGSRPFSRANAILSAQGQAPIDWRLD